jgi:type I restriction enzyme S subunit
LQAGDVLMNEGGDFDKLGRGHVWDARISPCIHQNHVFAVRPHGISSAWLNRVTGAAYAQFYFMSRSKQSTNLASISSTNVMELPVVKPPAAEQAVIDAFLDHETAKIDALVAEQEQLITLLKEKRQAVISHAVTKGLDPSVPMKDSGVEWLGEVPAHWSIGRIKHVVASFEQGWSPQCENFPVESESDWGVLKVGCVNGGIFKPEENKALPADLMAIPALGVCLGDLLISRANTRELVGSAAVVPADHQNLLLCDKLYRLRLTPSLCLPGFLSLFLSTELARGQIELAATGASSSMLNIAQSTILEMSVPMPPVAEQATLLSTVDQRTLEQDQLISEAVLSIELLKERRAALISAAVTGQIDVSGLASEPA